MTEQKILKKIERNDGYVWFNQEEQEVIKQALEKKVAKKPIEREHFICLNYECPICEGGLYHKQQYCDECGQGLKWGEEDG